MTSYFIIQALKDHAREVQIQHDMQVVAQHLAAAVANAQQRPRGKAASSTQGTVAGGDVARTGKPKKRKHSQQ